MTWQNSTHSQIQNHCQIGLMKLAMAGKQTECLLRLLSARLAYNCWDFVFTKSADDRKIKKQTNIFFCKCTWPICNSWKWYFNFKWKINLLSEIWSEICIVKKCECSENVVRGTRLASMGQKTSYFDDHRYLNGKQSEFIFFSVRIFTWNSFV